LVFNITFGKGLIENYLPKLGCFKVAFLQTNYFEGDIETYRGILKKGKTLKVIYFTNPPFEVFMDKKTVKVGYKDEEPQIFDRKDYKNPILEVLYNLNRLEDYFKVVSKKGNILVLKPLGELENYISDLIVEIKNGKISTLKVENGEENYTEIYILRIEPCKGDLKLNPNNGR